jgi:galactokinase
VTGAAIQASLTASFERLGMAPADVAGRVALARQAVTGFEQHHGRPPAWLYWVPGRIEIFGKHTDYAGGRSLVAAVPRGFMVAAAPRDDDRVVAYDARWNAAMRVDVGNSDLAFAGWPNYVAVVVRRLASNFPGAALGADVAFASDLPRSAGISSSSALVVGIARALVVRGQLDRRPEWSEAIQSPLDLAGYLGAVENGLSFKSLAGTSGVGTHGGSEDHTAILNCSADRVSAFAYVPVRPQGDAALPADWVFLVISSGIEAAKAGAAMARYNAASLSTRALVDSWRASRRAAGVPASGTMTLAGVLAQDPDGADAIREAVRRHPSRDFDGATLDRRLEHFMAEDARVPLALDAIAGCDRHAIGRLARATQEDAEGLLQNQIPETSALAALALESGAFASSSFGAGFGGSVWALAPALEGEEILRDWRRRYLELYPAVENVTGFLARPAPASAALSIT